MVQGSKSQQEGPRLPLPGLVPRVETGGLSHPPRMLQGGGRETPPHCQLPLPLQAVNHAMEQMPRGSGKGSGEERVLSQCQ